MMRKYRVEVQLHVRQVIEIEALTIGQAHEQWQQGKVIDEQREAHRINVTEVKKHESA